MKHPGIATVVEQLRQIDKEGRRRRLNEILGSNPDRFVDPAGFALSLDFNAHLVTEIGNARVCIW